MFKKRPPAPGPVENIETSLESNSKVIGVVCATFGESNTKQVLDFANAKQRNIDFFSQFSCYYQVLDFYQAFCNAETGEEGYARLLSEIQAQLRSSDTQKYDVIFLWDIVNYLTTEQTRGLFEMLQEFCHWKTYVYCMVSINRTIAAKPMDCYVADHNTVGYVHASDEEMVTNPNYHAQGLASAASGYQLQHSSLLKNGMKEMLFILARDTQ